MPANKINSTLVGKLFIAGFRSEWNIAHVAKRQTALVEVVDIYP